MVVGDRHILAVLTLAIGLFPSASRAGAASRFGVDDPRADPLVAACADSLRTFERSFSEPGETTEEDVVSRIIKEPLGLSNAQIEASIPDIEDQLRELNAQYVNGRNWPSGYYLDVKLCVYQTMLGLRYSASSATASPTSPVAPIASGQAPLLPNQRKPAPSQPAAKAKPPSAPKDPVVIAGLAAMNEVLGTPGGVLVKNTGKFDEDIGETALHCLKIIDQGVPARDLQLGNFCPYVVEATWCVMGADCNPTFSSMQTLAATGTPGSSYGIAFTSGKGRTRTVQYAACKGRDTISVYWEDPFTFTCRPAVRK